MSFHDIYGHKRKIETLRQGLVQKRVAHAYLFSGISAIGKKTLAVEFAKALNCEKKIISMIPAVNALPAEKSGVITIPMSFSLRPMVSSFALMPFVKFRNK